MLSHIPPGGMGYNGKGIYCSGWSGLCGDGGKGLCTWYLLCSECVETYKQEPLPNDDTNVSIPPIIIVLQTSIFTTIILFLYHFILLNLVL